MISPRKIALIANMAASAVALRLIKHIIAGPIQFINIPCMFAIISGTIFGPMYGLLVGFLSFIVSDIFLGLGLWSFITSSLCGFIGFLSGIIWKGKCTSKAEVLIISYLLLLMYDILSSTILYLLFMPPLEAFIISIIGLFLPVMGGYLYAVGPITEFSSAFLTSIIIFKVNGVSRIVNK